MAEMEFGGVNIPEGLQRLDWEGSVTHRLENQQTWYEQNGLPYNYGDDSLDMKRVFQYERYALNLGKELALKPAEVKKVLDKAKPPKERAEAMLESVKKAV